MLEKNVISKLIKFVSVFFSSLCFGDSILINGQYNQEQAIEKARNKVNIVKIREQQKQLNQDNAMSAKIYSITSIPSWRSLAFIRDSRVNGNINVDMMIKVINLYLSQNHHTELTSHQQSELSKESSKIYDSPFNRE